MLEQWPGGGTHEDQKIGSNKRWWVTGGGGIKEMGSGGGVGAIRLCRSRKKRCQTKLILGTGALSSTSSFW